MIEKFLGMAIGLLIAAFVFGGIHLLGRKNKVDDGNEREGS